MDHLLASILLLAGSPAPGPQPVDWTSAPRLEVQLASYEFRPSTIRLQSGRPVILRFTNVSGNDHDFTSRKFFSAAEVRESDRRTAAGGVIDVPAGKSVEVGIVPAVGRYSVACTHQYHETMGMKGEIVVD